MVTGRAHNALEDHTSAKSAVTTYLLVEPKSANDVLESYRDENTSEGGEVSAGTGENVDVY